MASDSSSSSLSSSSSSSSSSSDEEESIVEVCGNDSSKGERSSASATHDEDADASAPADSVEVGNGDTSHENTDDDGLDRCKVFVSRIPQTFNDASITRILEDQFGDDCVVEVSIVSERSEADGEGAVARPSERAPGDAQAAKHRGFGFVTFATPAHLAAALDAGTVRGSATAHAKRRHTLYLRPVVRDGEDGGCPQAPAAPGGNKNLCFLWTKFRCPYGEACKFSHEGEGGCEATVEKKKQKCFAFKKTGTCKLGAECPYSHDVVVATKPEKKADATRKAGDKALKDCINWKNKGKCRKGDRCPFRHDAAVRDKLLQKKNGSAAGGDGKRKREGKTRQALSIRVFGLNYDTTADAVRAFFAHCGPIVDLTFPLYEDSGRSKGYCGVLFQSPRAVQKAIALDGSELDGRWLQIQEGKMFLRQWEEVESERRKKGREERDGKGGKALSGEDGRMAKKGRKSGAED